MNDPIRLCVDFRRMPADSDPDAFAWLAGADALAIDPANCAIGLFDTLPVESALVLNGDPERDAAWCEVPGQWVCDQGLEATARLRDGHPNLHWIPRLSVSRTQVSYRFSGPAIGEGFSFYMPDTAAVKGWRVEGMPIEEAFAQAMALGFSELWLHSAQAASRNRGLDLDLLDKTQDTPCAVWLSGGVGNAAHLRNLTRVGGAAAVVVDAAVAQALSLATLREALIVETPRPEAVPMTFTPRKTNPDPGPGPH